MVKKIIKKISLRHIQELLVYGLVGASAWMMQTLLFIIFIKIHVFPSIAMALGNFGGFVIAYFGHIRFTFKKQHKFSHRDFIKFLLASVVGLMLNVAGVRIITKVLLLNPHYAIIPTIFTPGITFLISKFWVFK